MITKKKTQESIELFISFIDNNYKTFVPYSVTINDEIIIDKDQNVRNLFAIYKLLLIDKHVKKLSSSIKTKINNDISYYIDKFKQVGMRQASAFLALSINIVRRYCYFKDIICENLYKSLTKLERKFVLGQVLICLTVVCPEYKILKQEQIKMFNEIKEESEINVFRCNWQSNFLFSLWKKIGINESIKGHAIVLAKRFEKVIGQFKVEETETNYLAVCFEGCTALYRILGKEENLEKNIELLFKELEERMYKNGLYLFLNKTARIDITCHVLNGYMNLFY